MQPIDGACISGVLPALRADELASAAGTLAWQAATERRHERAEAAAWFEPARRILVAKHARRAGADASPFRELEAFHAATTALPPRDLIALAIEHRRYMDDVEAHCGGLLALFAASLLREVQQRLRETSRRVAATHEPERMLRAVGHAD